MPGGVPPRALFIPFKGLVPLCLVTSEKKRASREVATKDNPPDLKTKVDVSIVDVKDFSETLGCLHTISEKYSR